MSVCNKSAVIQVIQFQGFEVKKVQSDLIHMLDNSDCFWNGILGDDPYIEINILGGNFCVYIDDFIIKDAEGELHVYKYDIFKAIMNLFST